MFEGRRLFIATKHRKELVIAPLLESEFEVKCFTSAEFDTDIFGTFSGEIVRKHDALTTIRNKCIEAAKATNCSLIVASEGSFGAHPSLFFAHANEELIMLKDFQNNLEIVAKEISLDTNFNGSVVANETELLEFAKLTSFPSHGLILKSSENNCSKIIKEIRSEKELLVHFQDLKSEFGSAYVETDMRAMYNPTRMKVIKKATKNLITKINNCCPNCKTAGFDIIAATPGLPCENCATPTRSTLFYIYQCKNCAFSNQQFYPRKIKFEDPTYCDNCNP